MGSSDPQHPAFTCLHLGMSRKIELNLGSIEWTQAEWCFPLSLSFVALPLVSAYYFLYQLQQLFVLYRNTVTLLPHFRVKVEKRSNSPTQFYIVHSAKTELGNTIKKLNSSSSILLTCMWQRSLVFNKTQSMEAMAIAQHFATTGLVFRFLAFHHNQNVINSSGENR